MILPKALGSRPSPWPPGSAGLPPFPAHSHHSVSFQAIMSSSRSSSPSMGQTPQTSALPASLNPGPVFPSQPRVPVPKVATTGHLSCWCDMEAPCPLGFRKARVLSSSSANPSIWNQPSNAYRVSGEMEETETQREVALPESRVLPCTGLQAGSSSWKSQVQWNTSPPEPTRRACLPAPEAQLVPPPPHPPTPGPWEPKKSHGPGQGQNMRKQNPQKKWETGG